ncbi:hypothetical protein PS683_03728 [Pseudomonas fluorescens]|uniref:Uncharacterized protein n=1 Tax=Pseudomonas fluorescens TaxID=294 RepID=A0A5E6V0H0_PSEFL|nr:hypothetical protein PS683_03728 [Pseudomonas fluorescens]VVN08704.1 hypothetical protein PS683_03728 [Pseudomonas fluorescens]
MADSPWDMLSAVGTLAAVVVALGVSGHTAWANRRTEKDRTELAAAKMLSPIISLEGKAGYLYAFFSFYEEESVPQHASALLAIQELEVMARAISIDDLYPLLHLKNHAAKRVARALGLIQTFSTDALATLLHPSWGASRVRKVQYKRWAGMLSEINDHLAVAVSVCAEAASAGAPRPTPEEIHGP